jgi:hypothetical protein
MPWVANFDRTVCQIDSLRYLKNEAFTGLSFLVCVLLRNPGVSAMDAKKRSMRNPTLRRKSMELLKDITQMLHEILSSDDEEALRELEKTIRTLEQSRHKPGSHAIH